MSPLMSDASLDASYPFAVFDVPFVREVAKITTSPLRPFLLFDLPVPNPLDTVATGDNAKHVIDELVLFAVSSRFGTLFIYV